MRVASLPSVTSPIRPRERTSDGKGLTPTDHPMSKGRCILRKGLLYRPRPHPPRGNIRPFHENGPGVSGRPYHYIQKNLGVGTVAS